MKEFNLAQLRYAEEVCFKDDFIKLFNKYALNSLEENLGLYHWYYICSDYQGKVLNWIFHWSRADMKNAMGGIIEGMLTDLIGDYKG